MRLFLPLFLFCACFAAEAKPKDPLRSEISVQKGVFAKRWEYSFFRHLQKKDLETPDTETGFITDAAPDTWTVDADHVPAVQHVKRVPSGKLPQKEPVLPSLAVQPEEKQEKVPEEIDEFAVDQPVQKKVRVLETVKREKESLDTMPVKEAQTAEPEDKNKRQKERIKQFETRRKKGSFRDPKITY